MLFDLNSMPIDDEEGGAEPEEEPDPLHGVHDADPGHSLIFFHPSSSQLQINPVA
jgi:hypothetical protein